MPATAWDLVADGMADLRALQGAIAVLSWDQETYLPPRGVPARAEQLATLQGVLHARLTAPALGEALARAEEEVRREDGDDPAAPRPAALRALRFERDRAGRVPERLVRELASAQASSVAAWRGARARSDFPGFAAHLARVVALRREQADALGVPPGGERYDALLEGNEPGMRAARLEPLFARLERWLAPLVARLADRPAAPDPLAGRPFADEAQWAFSLEILEAMGFDAEAGRQDRSAHPFTLGVDPGDVRITTRVVPDRPLSAFFSTVHEAGHALYEQGLPAEHRRTFVCAAASMGLHESQSRLWENQVARSLPFWRHFHPRLSARWPAAREVPLEAFHRAVNRVQRSLVRVEADEVTYNLHVALRFSLELALLRGALEVADLPAAWGDAMQRLLGVRPARDGEGVLQDIHWAMGELGYFPTYTLGNLYAATLFAAARRDLPGLEEGLARGELAPLRGWLRERVHRLGRSLPAEEIVRRATGRGLADDDFRAYLEAKYATLDEP